MALLDDHARTRLADDGFLILPALIDPATRERFLERFGALVERARAMDAPDGAYSLAPGPDGRPLPGVLHKVQGVALEEPATLELAAYPPLLDRVAQVLGPGIDVFGTKFFPMNVPGATSTGWHTDNYYFGTDSDRVLSCAIYLHDTDTGNGCLRVLPGSHRQARPEHTPGQGSMAHGHWADVDESRAVDVVCPAGTVVLFSANLLHGARPNASGRASFRTAWHYLPADLALAQFPRGGYRDRHILREP